MNDFTPNEMTYNGNHVFHFTSFEAAIRIIASGRLRFGLFKNMNDIAEVHRDLWTVCDNTIIESILEEYRSISLTKDSGPNDRGFAIDTLWGYYARKGNGACLVFNKTKLLGIYKDGYACPGVPDSLEIDYPELFTNRLDFDGNNIEEVREEIQQSIKDIFYVKDSCWKHEQEVRLLTINNEFLPINDSLLGIVLCMPKQNNVEDTEEYAVLQNLQKLYDFQIYRYTTINGEKSLYCGEVLKWPILTVDYNLY